MVLVVFVRGGNVGGHRAFRPSVLARELSRYAVTNVGAAGTFIVRKPGSRTAFLTALRRKLPFEATVAVCSARELIRLEASHPFGARPPKPGLTRFLGILSKPGRARPVVPLNVPANGEWLVRVLSYQGRFVFGEYRRHMKTIACLGKIDKLFGAPATTRSWKTILDIAEAVSSDQA